MPQTVFLDLGVKISQQYLSTSEGPLWLVFALILNCESARYNGAQSGTGREAMPPPIES